jgi:hypothetical protein
LNLSDLKKIFVLNTETYGKQAITDEGKVVFYQIKDTLTPKILKDHTDGLCSISTFPVLDGKTKWFCIDVDLEHDIYAKEGFTYENFKEYEEGLDTLTQTYKVKLDTLGLRNYSEKTGGKGRHIWVFFNPVAEVAELRASILPELKEIVYDKKIFNVEFFPESETSKSVKIPFGKSLRWKGTAGEDAWSIFECPLENIVTNSPVDLFKISNPLRSIYTKCRAFRELKEKADTVKNLRHNERVAIGTMLYKKKVREIEFVEEYFFTGLDNYDHDITRKNLTSAAEGMRPVRCSWMQEKSICSEQCKEIGNYVSPVAFAEGASQKEKKLSADNAVIIKPEDNLIYKDNMCMELTRNNELVVISNFTIVFKELEETEEGDDRYISSQIYKGVITNNKGEEYPIEISTEKYLRDETFVNAIFKVLRLKDTQLNTRKLSQLRMAISKYSDPVIIRKTKNFGFSSDFSTYFTPSVKVNKDGVFKNDELIVDIEAGEKSLERFLDFTLTEPSAEEEWKNFFIEKIFKLYVTAPLPISLFAFAFDLFIEHLYASSENDNSYVYWLRGETGTGKTSFAALAQRLFGKFPSVTSFSSTSSNLEYLGHIYKDCVFPVDDFKRSAVRDDRSLQAFITLIQNYSDHTGRGRMTKDMKVRTVYSVRGNLLITGEDTISQEPSMLARTVSLFLRKSDVTMDHTLFSEVMTKSITINEWTPYLIKYALSLNQEEVRNVFNEFRTAFSIKFDGKENQTRVAVNMAKMCTSALYFCKYLLGEGEMFDKVWGETEVYLKKVANDAITYVNEESYTSKFWNTYNELLAINAVRVLPNANQPDDERIPIVGFMKDMRYFIMHSQAYDKVTKHLASSGSPLKVSANTLAENMHSAGLYMTDKSQKQYLNGKQVRVYEVNPKEMKKLMEGESV